jgi:tetratricopeptide (TPR) repeat protein
MALTPKELEELVQANLQDAEAALDEAINAAKKVGANTDELDRSLKQQAAAFFTIMDEGLYEVQAKIDKARATIAKLEEVGGPEYSETVRLGKAWSFRVEARYHYTGYAAFGSQDLSDKLAKKKANCGRRALELFREEIRLEEPSAAIFIIVGLLEREFGSREQALADFRRARALDPNGERGREALTLIQEIEEENEGGGKGATPPQSGGCIIATACLGGETDIIAALRKLRDDSISSDPVARDFFHVFWSRYYEWSPGVARIAAQDKSVRESIRWSFLDPWIAWMEFATLVGRREISELSDTEQQEILARLGRRLKVWLDEIPDHMESKCPPDPAKVFESFERFRESALKVFRN